MRRCAVNDCNCNSPELPLCCFDCQDQEQCPDRCPKTETIYCVGVIENDGKRVPETTEEP